MTSELTAKLLQRGRSPGTGPGTESLAILPVNEVPMVLTLEQLRPNPDNPRTSRNPKYDDIKASIHARGLDSVPKVTKDPESIEDVYIFSDGGNTRYSILTELYAETGDERFRRVQCMVKPWPGRLQCVIGHLAENDVRGDLSFIEKAFGIEKARSIYQEQLGREISQRELADLLKEAGYPVHHSNISRMVATIEYLWPWMPNLLNSGMGRPQITQLIALRIAAEKAWKMFSQQTTQPVEQEFETVFGEVCRAFDDPDSYSPEVFKDELIAALLRAIPDPLFTYDRWLIELDPQEQNRRKLFGSPEPVPLHVLDADKADSDEPLPLPSPQPASVGLSPAATSHTPKTIVADEPACPEECPGQQDEVQPELDDHNAPPKVMPETDFPAEAMFPDRGIAESGEIIQPVSMESSVAFAASGLEPVMDIWYITALQDDVEHLQDMAFRLAFELAEVLGVEGAIEEDKSAYGAGFTLETSPESELLAMLCGGTTYSSLSKLTGLMIGTSGPFDDPVFDDIHMVKLLRLIRVLRRLRELQRLSFREENV